MCKEVIMFSIIILIYNTEKYLVECIESVLSQTYKNIEIILVNDGSKGNAEEKSMQNLRSMLHG